MMPRRFACGWKSRLPHKEHKMCRFELHLRSCSYRNPEKTTDLPPQVTDKLHHKHLCCIRIRLATRNGINYLSPRLLYQLDWISHSCTQSKRLVLCYNMFKLTSTFLVNKKMHGIATVLFKVVVFFFLFFFYIK